MKIDFAPLEGVTDAVFRRTHRRCFGGVDRYYLPFISPTGDHLMTPKEARELSPKENDGVCAVPQFLTKNAEDFLWAADYAKSLGYKTVNLNLGCPSGTVTAKGKGAGMLADPQALDRFLWDVFSRTPVAVSVKTRIGMTSPEEFDAILDVYRGYPLDELILHPRTAKEQYRGEIHPEAYEKAVRLCPFPVTFNGGLVTAEQVAVFSEKYPKAKRVMIGRGLVADPMLAMKIAGTVPDEETYRETFRSFYDDLYQAYCEKLVTPHHILFRMKELWGYFLRLFDDESGTYRKRIGKSKSIRELEEAAEAVLTDLAIRPSLPAEI